jgi:phospholipid transport system substrate-binding protein
MASSAFAAESIHSSAWRARRRRAAALDAWRWLPTLPLPLAGLTGLVAAFLMVFAGYALAFDGGSPGRAVGASNSVAVGFVTDAQVEVLSRIAPAAGPPAAATSPRNAAHFVQQLGEAVGAVMADAALAPSQRHKALRGLLLEGFEVETIGRIVLGRYWHDATPGQLAEYQRLFTNFLVTRYVDRFVRYGEAKIDLTGARPGKRNLAIIESRVKVPGRRVVRIDWLVRTSDGGQRIIDLIVNGLSMAVIQRLEFTSIIEKNGGNLDGLLAALRAKTT